MKILLQFKQSIFFAWLFFFTLSLCGKSPYKISWLVLMSLGISLAIHILVIVIVIIHIKIKRK